RGAGSCARPEGKEDEVVHPLSDSEPVLAERGEVDVVLEGHRQAQPLGELVPERPLLEAGYVGRESHSSGAGLDHAGDAYDDAVDQIVSEAGRLDERGVQTGDCGERVVGVGIGELGVLARANASGDVAEGATDETRA